MQRIFKLYLAIAAVIVSRCTQNVNTTRRAKRVCSCANHLRDFKRSFPDKLLKNEICEPADSKDLCKKKVSKFKSSQTLYLLTKIDM